MNLDDIRSMGIVAARKLKLEDVLQGVFEGETYTANPYRHEDEHHNAIEQGYEVRNLYDGNLVSRHRIQWSYHEPAKEGRVKEIDVQDGNMLKRIEHDKGGKVIRTKQFVVAEETIGDRLFESAAGGLTGAAEAGADLVIGGPRGFIKRIFGR